MTKEQVQIIMGLFAGYEIALVHLATLLDARGVMTRADIAASFRATAQTLPSEAVNRAQVLAVLNQLASLIESSSTATELSDELRRLLN